MLRAAARCPTSALLAVVVLPVLRDGRRGPALRQGATRTGANRARLMIAAGATVVFGVMIVLIGIGALPNTSPACDAGNGARTGQRLGYLVAFAAAALAAPDVLRLGRPVGHRAAAARAGRLAGAGLADLRRDHAGRRPAPTPSRC